MVVANARLAGAGHQPPPVLVIENKWTDGRNISVARDSSIRCLCSPRQGRATASPQRFHIHREAFAIN